MGYNMVYIIWQNKQVNVNGVGSTFHYRNLLNLEVIAAQHIFKQECKDKGDNVQKVKL